MLNKEWTVTQVHMHVEMELRTGSQSSNSLELLSISFTGSVGTGESVLCATFLYPLKMQTAVAISVSPSLGEVMVFALIFSSQFPL